MSTTQVSDAMRVTTSLDATKLTGNLPAISGASLTGLPPSKIVQVVNTQTGAVATGTTAIVQDDTIPQQTEGSEFMTLAITPTDASNKLLIQVTVILATATANAALVTALFQDSTANAIAAAHHVQDAVANWTKVITFSHYMTAGTTSATTFKVRSGDHAGGTVTINGVAGGRKLGGVQASSITITEIAV